LKTPVLGFQQKVRSVPFQPRLHRFLSFRMPPSFRIVHEPSPADDPDNDLHIWSPSTAADFKAWQASRENPLWIGVDARNFTGESFATFYKTVENEAACFVLYTYFECDDANAPCGCYGYHHVCDYHRDGREGVAACGCCAERRITCAYHAH
jgi:hypothetical protein